MQKEITLLAKKSVKVSAMKTMAASDGNLLAKSNALKNVTGIEASKRFFVWV
jgi:hypothetical protein